MTVAYWSGGGAVLGATPTTSDTFTDGSTGWSALNIGAGSSLTYDTMPDGSMPALNVSTTSSVTDHLDWGTGKFAATSSCFYRFYFWLTGALPATWRPLDTNTFFQLAFNSAQKLVLSLNSVVKYTSTMTFSTATRYRCELFWAGASTSTNQYQIKIFAGESTTALEDSGLITGQTGLAGPTSVTRWVSMSGIANLPATYVGGMVANTAGWIGPALFVAGGTAAATLSISNSVGNAALSMAGSATAVLAVVGSVADTSTFTQPDSATAALAVSNTAADALNFADTATAVLVLANTSAGALKFATSGTASLAIAGSAADVLAFPSSGTATLSIVGSISDQLNFPVTSTASLAVNSTATGALRFPVTATASLVVAGTAATALKFVSTGTAALIVSNSAADTLRFPATGTATLSISGTSANALTFAAAATATLIVSDTATGALVFTETATATLVVAASAADVLAFLDAATAALVVSNTAGGVLGPGVVTAETNISVANTAADTSTFSQPDSGTASLVVAGSTANVLRYVVGGIATLTISGTVSDIATTVVADTATAALTVAGSAGVSGLNYSPSGIAVLDIEGSAGPQQLLATAGTADLVVDNAGITASAQPVGGQANLVIANIITKYWLVDAITDGHEPAPDIVVTDISESALDTVITAVPSILGAGTAQTTVPSSFGPDTAQTILVVADTDYVRTSIPARL